MTDVSGQREDIEIRSLLDAIYHRFHYDFRRYSMASVRRRLAQARIHLGCDTISRLQERLLHEPAVFPQLLQFLTVQVSDLFRDPSYFAMLRAEIVPQLKTYPSIKVWVAGCANGEEAYSLAILFREEGLFERTTFYATDINADALKRAESGVYPLDRVAAFSDNYRLAGGRLSLSEYYTAAYQSVGGVRPVAPQARGLLGSQPGDRQRVRRGAGRHLSQRAHLLRSRAAKSRPRPVQGRPLPARLSRAGRPKETLQLLGVIDAFTQLAVVPAMLKWYRRC